MPDISTTSGTADETTQQPKVKRQWSQEAKERAAKRRAEAKERAAYYQYCVEQLAESVYEAELDKNAVSFRVAAPKSNLK